MIVFSLAAFFFNGNDFFQPSVIVCLSYVISILSAAVNIKVWDIDLHSNTFLVITAGAAIFVVVNGFVNCIGRNKGKSSFKKSLQYIRVQSFKIVLICLYQIGVAVVYAKTVKNLVSRDASFDDFSSMMAIYRQSSYSTSSDIKVPLALNQFVKLSEVFAFIFLYIFINNLILKSKRRRNLLNLLPVIIYGFQVILTGGRFELLVLVCGAVVLYNVLWHRKHGWNRQFGVKFFCKLIIILMLVFLGFYSSKALVGRTEKTDVITYITSYTGGSIQLLDMYLQDPIPKSNVWGKETFYAMNSFLVKLKLLNMDSYIPHLEFRVSNNVIIGNVYTAYRRYIQDFGISGMVILQTIFALFYSIFYKRVKIKASNKKLDYGLLVYSMVAFPLFMHSINDNFYSNVVSGYYLIIIVFAKIFSSLIIDVKFCLKLTEPATRVKAAEENKAYCTNIYYRKLTDGENEENFKHTLRVHGEAFYL